MDKVDKDIRPAGTDNLFHSGPVPYVCVFLTVDGSKGQRRKGRAHDKVIPDARESKPEGSGTKVQRRKPPSAKAPKSEGC